MQAKPGARGGEAGGEEEKGGGLVSERVKQRGEGGKKGKKKAFQSKGAGR